MSDHTPGEWTVSKNMGEEPVVVSANRRDNDGYHICQTFGKYKHGNAVLISAAPDLLAALLEAETYLHSVLCIKPDTVTEAVHETVIAAIAKAKGEILENKA